MRGSLLSLCLLLLLGTLGACSEPDIADAPALRYHATDREGGVPSAAAQKSLITVVSARLSRIGYDHAVAEFVGANELRVAVPGAASDALEIVDAEVQRNIDLQFRVRLPPRVENEERRRRASLGANYEPNPGYVWIPLEGSAEDMLCLFPEVPVIASIEALRAAAEPDEARIQQAEEGLRQLLLREVFGAGDLVSAHPVPGADSTSVRVDLHEDRREPFREFTTHYQQHALAILVNGAAIAAPFITQPLSEAILLNTGGGGMSASEAAHFAEAVQRAAYGTVLERIE